MSDSALAGSIDVQVQGAVARVVVNHAARFNAMTRSMWRQLAQVFAELGARADLRCVVLQGQGDHFCAGGDISEYPSFRFNESTLREFHENEVWGGLQAILSCDVPVVASIRGNCMGAGVELASCCDLRLASDSARFGAPIGKLGFPMAPREAQLVATRVGDGLARAMLLGAQVLSAQRLLESGFLLQTCAPDDLEQHTDALVQTVLSLGPQAARLNKQTLRALTAAEPSAPLLTSAYDYADSPEHQEGVGAFVDKRRPVF